MQIPDVRRWFAGERQAPAVEPAAGGLTVQLLTVNRMQVQTIKQGVWTPGVQIERTLPPCTVGDQVLSSGGETSRLVEEKYMKGYVGPMWR